MKQPYLREDHAGLPYRSGRAEFGGKKEVEKDPRFPKAANMLQAEHEVTVQILWLDKANTNDS